MTKPRLRSCCRIPDHPQPAEDQLGDQECQAFLKVQQEFGSIDACIWGFVDGKPIQNALQTMSDIPAVTELSEAISKDLKKRGFSFVDPTIIYAFMEAVGMVNDHTADCFHYDEVAAEE